MNGDGRPDYVAYYNNTTGQAGLWVLINNGNGFNAPQNWNTAALLGNSSYSQPRWSSTTGQGDLGNLIDMNGDGRPDYVAYYNTTTGQAGLWLLRNSGPLPDLLASISNGIGGTTTMAYAPSTQYTNTQLPFPIQTVSSITTNDGNGNVSTTTYSFSGGFYHIGER